MVHGSLQFLKMLTHFFFNYGSISLNSAHKPTKHACTMQNVTR